MADDDDSTAAATEVEGPPAVKRVVVCSHDVVEDLIHYTNELGYFKENYLARSPHWPKKCQGDSCGIAFVDKPKPKVDEATEFKVSRTSPVFLCRNAAQSKHECVFALCEPCKNRLENKREPEDDDGITRGLSKRRRTGRT